jgi:hypothetical protein
MELESFLRQRRRANSAIGQRHGFEILGVVMR